MKKWLLLILCMSPFLVQANPLPAAEVFHFSVSQIDPNTFVMNWEIKPNYFLYQDRISLSPAEDSNVQLGPLRFPPSMIKTDKQGHTYKVYRHKLAIPVSVLGHRSGETIIKVHYQGCADDGFCYPPEIKLVKLGIDKQLALFEVSLEQSAKESLNLPQSTPEMSQLFTEHHWGVTLLLFFGLGLLLSFTPCILPMVPVLSGIIVGHGKSVTTRKAFFLSLSYVLSMSLTYAIFGAVVALLGANLQIKMQSPWIITLFSLIFVGLAFSMFGFYAFKLPHSWQNKIAGNSANQRRGHYLGAAIMGCLSTLILSPCVTAPLIGVLTYIAQTRDIVFGSLTLFTLGLGMGTPLLLIGTSAGKWLPESGPWMNTVKGFFGILLLGVAIYLMARILPAEITMLLWSILLIFSGVYAGALTHSVTHHEKFHQGTGIILLTYGLLILIGASMGATNPLQPLVKAPFIDPQNKTASPTVKTLSELQTAIQQSQGKPIMLDFYAEWCTACKIMNATTFKNAAVQEALSPFQVIKIDLTANDTHSQQLLHSFNVIAPPTFLFLDRKGQELSSYTVVGERSTKEFLFIVEKVRSHLHHDSISTLSLA